MGASLMVVLADLSVKKLLRISVPTSVMIALAIFIPDVTGLARLGEAGALLTVPIFAK